MKLLIAVTCLFVVALATVPHSQLVNRELYAPFADYYKYLQCVPTQIDQYAMEYDCESIWDEYREDFLDTIKAFEDCTERLTSNEIEECRYKEFGEAEQLLDLFYKHLMNYNDIAYKVIPWTIRTTCMSDDMLYDPDNF